MFLAIFLLVTASVCDQATAKWKDVSGKLVSISVDRLGVWGVNSDGRVWHRRNTYGAPNYIGNGWIEVHGEKLVQIDAGGMRLFGVNNNSDIFFREGIDHQNHVGTAWQKVNGRLTYVSVSPAGSVWGVNKDDEIWFLEGSDNCNQDEGNWNKINGKLQQISAGFSGVWGVNSNGDIFYRSGTFGDNKVIGSGWEKVSIEKLGDNDTVTHVTSGDAKVLAVTRDGVVYQRKGVSPITPTGTAWRRVRSLKDVDVKVIDIYCGTTWAVSKSGDILYNASC